MPVALYCFPRFGSTRVPYCWQHRREDPLLEFNGHLTTVSTRRPSGTNLAPKPRSHTARRRRRALEAGELSRERGASLTFSEKFVTPNAPHISGQEQRILGRSALENFVLVEEVEGGHDCHGFFCVYLTSFR